MDWGIVAPSLIRANGRISIKSIMGRNIKAIIFDWGRTLYNPDIKQPFPGVMNLLEYLSGKYTLAIVALASDGNVERRMRVIREHDMGKYFASIFIEGGNDKDRLYDALLVKLAIPSKEAAIVDDRVVRGIRWGNQHGCVTVWMKQGKFSAELPDKDTGRPRHTIHDIREPKELF